MNRIDPGSTPGKGVIFALLTFLHERSCHIVQSSYIFKIIVAIRKSLKQYFTIIIACVHLTLISVTAIVVTAPFVTAASVGSMSLAPPSVSAKIYEDVKLLSRDQSFTRAREENRQRGEQRSEQQDERSYQTNAGLFAAFRM